MPVATLVHIHVRPEARAAFEAATHANRAASICEPGNLRFDFLRDPENPDRYFLYEVYADEAAARAHKDTPHYAAWRDAVADMMASPRRGQPLTVLGV